MKVALVQKAERTRRVGRRESEEALSSLERVAEVEEGEGESRESFERPLESGSEVEELLTEV